MVSSSKWRLLQFVAISGGGWLLDVGLMSWLVARHLSPATANAISAATALLFVFAISQRRVFLHDGSRLWVKLSAYAAYNFVAVLLASAAVGTLAPVLLHLGTVVGPSAADLDLDVAAAVLAKVMITPLTLYANFVFMTWLLEGRLALI